MFPFSVKLTQKLNTAIQEKRKVLDAVNKYVERNKGQDIKIIDFQLTFNISLFGLSFDKFAQIEKGTFVINDNTITFQYFMYRLFIVSIIFSIIGTYASQTIVFGVFLFVFIVLGNWLIAFLKFRTMLKDLADYCLQQSI